MAEETPGIDVLNCGAGHLKFRFDKSKSDEVEKAKKVLTDMLKRGYMLFAIVDGEHKRIRSFDPNTEEYILEEPDVPEAEEKVADLAISSKRRPGRPKGKRVAMQSTRATAIGPTAGG